MVGMRAAALILMAALILAGACTFDRGDLRWGDASTAGGDAAVGEQDVSASSYDAVGAGKDTGATLADAPPALGGTGGAGGGGGAGGSPRDVGLSMPVDTSPDVFRVQVDAPLESTIEAGHAEGGGGTDASTPDVSLDVPVDASADLFYFQGDALLASRDLPATTCSPAPKSTGGIACPGDVCSAGAYSGSTLTATDGLTSTVCMSSNSLCAAGSTNTLQGAATSNWGIAFGFFLSPSSTATNPVGIPLAGSGISISLSSLPTGAQARLQVTVSGTNYCATITALSQTFPWSSFDTTCWNATGGTYLTGAPTAATLIAITVNAEGGVIGSFDFCVTSLSFPGSETCPTGYHDGGNGICLQTGTCSTGYHDGGNGTCVVAGTCSAGYNNCSGTCSSSACSVPCLLLNCVNGVCTCEM